MFKTGLHVIGFALVVILLAAAPLAAQENTLTVVASTSIIADVAQNVMGDLGTVAAVIPAEVDEHTFVPSPSDIVTIVDADVLLVNGGMLEEGLMEIIEENATAAPVIVSMGVEVLARPDEDHEEHEGEEGDHEHGTYEVVGVLGDEGVCEEGHEHEGEAHEAEATEAAEGEGHEDEHEHEHGGCDPHFWTNPANVMIWVDNIAAALSAADAPNAEAYAANAEAYKAELAALIEEIDALVATIPEDARVIVTNHEFLAYFAAVYGFEVVGTVIPGVTTSTEVAPQDIIDLVEVIEAEGVTAIFAETTASTALAETIAAEVGRDVVIATLYSGALSRADGPAATYIDYMRYNVTTIASALSSTGG